MSDGVSYRKLLFYGGFIYAAWWVAVRLIFPDAFNPLGSRLAVVGLILAVPLLSERLEFVRKNLRLLFQAAVWLITAHFFYLFYGNGGDANWVVGTYITVIAINLGLLTAASLLWYSGFVLAISVAMTIALPELRQSVFLPGIVTIAIQANLALRSRLQALQRLAESNERFQLLFNSSFDGVMVHENRRILAANEALARISGYALGQLIGRDALDLVAPEEHAHVLGNMARNYTAPYETLALRADGTKLEIEMRGKPFVFEGRQTRLVTVQPIADRKKAERERVIAQAMAENVRLRDEFISIASHELKTPLSSLKMQTQIIDRQIQRDPASLTPAKLKDFSALVSRQADRLNRLVEAMLDVSLIANEKVQLDIQRFDLAHATRELVGLSTIHTGKSPVRVDVEAPPSLWIEGDRHRLQQVIDNLLSNAYKYGNGNPVNIRLRAEGDEAVLDFEDRGIGIAEESRARIFGKFERAISAHSISGLGLGLYISQQIVEAHGGKISVQSELGVRSVFTVRLPLKQARPVGPTRTQ